MGTPSISPTSNPHVWTVSFTLTRTPITPGLTIAYAHNSDAAYNSVTAGFPAGRCGLLRDSDPFMGYNSLTFLGKIPNYNFCVEFAQSVS
jgi:hypothetical protein